MCFQEEDDYECSSSKQHHFISQEELNDLIRDLDLPKTNGQQWNLLQKGMKIVTFRKRHYMLAVFFQLQMI